jgi:protein-tyrosine-phosphatase
MKFFGKSKDSDHKKNVLFVCVENAGRSQMAEGFFRKYSPKGFDPLNAGTRPVSDINPLAIEAMRDKCVNKHWRILKMDYKSYSNLFLS